MKCEMKDCTTLAKLNSVFCRVFEADLEGQDGKVIKSKSNESKAKQTQPRTNNHKYPLHDPRQPIILPTGSDAEDHVQTT